MKTWKQKTVIGVFAIIALVFVVVACEDEGGPDGKPDLTGSVKIDIEDGVLEVGKILTADTSGLNGTAGKYSYQWKRSPDGSPFVEIAGETGRTYWVTEADIGYALGVDVTNADTEKSQFGATENKVSMADWVGRKFENKKMFAYNGTNYVADIADGRTGARYKTLEQLDIVAQLQSATAGAFAVAEKAGSFERNRFMTIFNPNGGNPNGKVKMTVENDVEYDSYAVYDSANVRFNIDWLLDEKLSDDDLQAAITAAVVEMRGLIATIERSATRNDVRMASVGASRQHLKPLAKGYATVPDTKNA
jgi:hypothetical protein